MAIPRRSEPRSNPNHQSPPPQPPISTSTTTTTNLSPSLHLHLQSPPPLLIYNHRSEPRSNPQALISTSTTIYLNSIISMFSHTQIMIHERMATTCERMRLRPVFMMLGQTHVNGWSRVIAS